MWTSLSDCGRVNMEGKNLLRWVTSVRSYSPGMIFKNAVIRTMCLITASLYSALLVINITCSFHLYPDKYNISTLKRLERQWLNRKRTNDLKKWIKLGYPQATTYSLTFRGGRDSGDFVIYEHYPIPLSPPWRATAETSSKRKGVCEGCVLGSPVPTHFSPLFYTTVLSIFSHRAAARVYPLVYDNIINVFSPWGI